ncbi:MAG: TetR/AcrR family transcriptional regulator [Dehalococcoidia bacterium]|jgi:AcrR family transcriptional regulator
MISESVSRTERRRARNRAALIASARRLFAELGFEATTIAAIAASADLGFGTFYLYFRDKDAILDAVLEIGRLELDKALTHPDNERADPAEALRRLTTRFARAAERNYDVMALGFRMAVGGEGVGEPIRPDLNKGAVPIFFLLGERIRRIIERGVTEGVFACPDPRLVSRFVTSAHVPFLTPHTKREGRKMIETLCDLELRALSATSPRRQSERRGP